MRKGILVLAVALVSVVALAADSSPPIPREGSGSFVNVLSGTVNVLPLGTNRFQVTYDVMGASTGEGLFQGASIRCIGSMLAVNGAFDDESGSCVHTLPSGDQIFSVHKAVGKLGVAAKGTFTLVGGTGKLAGITGGGEFTRVQVRPAAERTTQSVTRGTMKYKLP